MNTIQKKMAVLFTVFGGLFLLTVVVFGFIYLIFYKISDYSMVRVVAHTFSLPAARVGSATVSYEHFLQTRDAVRRFLSSEAATAVQAVQPNEEELNRNILDQLIRQRIVESIAAEKAVAVTDEEVRAFFGDIVNAASSTVDGNISEYLWNNYGWHEEDFRQEVLRPAILEQKLAIEMSKQSEGDPMALEQAIADRRSRSDVRIYLRMPGDTSISTQ